MVLPPKRSNRPSTKRWSPDIRPTLLSGQTRHDPSPALWQQGKNSTLPLLVFSWTELGSMPSPKVDRGTFVKIEENIESKGHSPHASLAETTNYTATIAKPTSARFLPKV